MTTRYILSNCINALLLVLLLTTAVQSENLDLGLRGESLQSIEIPSQAAAVGFTRHTFSSTFDAKQVDINGSSRSGFKWYPWKFFGHPTNLDKIHLNGDGSVTLGGDTTGPNAELATATPTNTPAKFIGTAFGGGGYFEAVFKFNPQDVKKANFSGWPSFWSLAIEQAALGTDQWPGQAPGYEHFIEVDFFEFNIRHRRPNIYSGGMGDWYGKFGNGQTVVWSGTLRRVPRGTDFTQYHKYGFLWVPATATKMGYAKYYFDGVQVGTTTQWTQYLNQSPPPTAPWVFGIIDQNHLVLILGTGISEPMTVQSVDVWQASDSQNMVN